MNLLVGATGFVGGHLVEYLFQQGEISKGVFRMGSHLKILDANGVQGMEADLLDHHSLHEAMEGVDVVYNLASPMPGTEEEFLRLNTEGILNLLEVAKESKANAFVHLSTLDVHGFGAKGIDPASVLNPGEPYQRGKAEAERLLLEFSKRNQSPKVVILRAARALGSRDSSLVVPILRMAETGKVSMPDGGPLSLSHPLDIAQAMYKASVVPAVSGSVYLIKSFDASPIDIAKAIVSRVGSSADVKRQGRFESSRFQGYVVEQLRSGLKIPAQAGWAELGYSPQFDLDKTAEEIAKWYKKEPWVTEAA